MYWLSPTLSSNDPATRSGPLSQLFAAVFRQAGFSHHINLCRYNKEGDICRIELRCTHSKLYQTQRDPSQSNKRNSRTRRPLSSESRCKFRVNVYYSTVHSRFFLPKVSGGCLHHTGHLKLLPHEVPTTAAHVQSSDLEETLNQLQLHIPTAIIKSLLQSKSNASLQPRQLRHLREISFDRTNFDSSQNKSSAEKLIHFLHNCPSVEYITYTAEKRHGSQLITLRKKKRRAGLPVEEHTDDVLPQTAQDAASHAAMLIDALSLNEGTEVLLVAAWTTLSGKRLFTMYPEKIGFDTTHKTNNEERPHFRGTIVDSNGKNVPVLDAFLPSEARHVFNFLFHEAVPFLFGRENCKRLQLAITDQDELCLSQLRAAQDNGIFPLMKVRLCHWHKVNRGFELDARKRMNTSTPIDRVVTKVYVQWLYSISYYLRSMRQLRHSEILIWKWVNDQDISPSLKEWMKLFWENSYKPVLHYLGYWNYRGVYGANLASNSFQESENRALKYDFKGPNPNCGIHRSAELTVAHTQERHDRQQGIASVEVNTRQLPKESSDKLTSELSRDFNPTVLRQLLRQYNSRVYYCHCQEGKLWYVRRKSWKPLDYGHAHPLFFKTVVPTYDNTYTVRNDNQCLWCDCGMFQEQGITCRHIYCVIDETPRLGHTIPEKTKVFQAQYGRNEGLTRQFDLARDLRARGPLLTVVDIRNMNRDRSNDDKTFFLDALEDAIPILRPGMIHEEEDDLLSQASIEETSTIADVQRNHQEFQRTAYQDLSQILSRRVDLVDNPEDVEFLYQRDMETLRELYRRKRERAGTGDDNAKVADLPIINKGTMSYKRKRKVSSRLKPMFD